MELHCEYNKSYINTLDKDKNFVRVFDNATRCYKFYWLEALIILMEKSEEKYTFNEIINEMICNAWYPVVNFHLRLGVTIEGKYDDSLENAVKVLESDNLLKKNASKEEVRKAILRNSKALRRFKTKIARNVPYRFLSPFLKVVNESLWEQRRVLIDELQKIDEVTPLPYTILDDEGLKKRIFINPQWRQFFKDNYRIIYEWIQYNKMRYLQDRNPGVPGIIYKIDENNVGIRKLNNARALWKVVAEVSGKPIRDIYTGEKLSVDQFDLDHFIPWSFIANDELWNLTPMDRRLNSRKGNKLPNWDVFFNSHAANQYFLNEMIFSNKLVRKKFEECLSDNLNAIWAADTLYIGSNNREQFRNILEHNMRPLYEAAQMQGFEMWEFPEQS